MTFEGVSATFTRIGSLGADGAKWAHGTALNEHIEFDHCEFSGSTIDGMVSFRGTAHSALNRCWFHDSGTDTTQGDQLKFNSGAKYWNVLHSVFERSSRDAIDCYDAGTGLIDGVLIVDPGAHGIEMKQDSDPANLTHRTIVRGSRVVNAGTRTPAVAMQLSQDNVVASDNIVEGGSSHGFRCGVEGRGYNLASTSNQRVEFYVNRSTGNGMEDYV